MGQRHQKTKVNDNENKQLNEHCENNWINWSIKRPVLKGILETESEVKMAGSSVCKKTASKISWNSVPLKVLNILSSLRHNINKGFKESVEI